MPRPERPVDPAGGVVARFAHELRTLRQHAGSPTYRQLAASSGYSITTLSHAAGGRRLPSLEVALAYAVACGGDRGDWSARWHAAAVAVAGERPAAPDRPPYAGSREFRESEADLFFGRDRLVDDIVARCATARVVVVRGASGAGVSSLLAAGVLPALRARDTHAVVVTSRAELPADEDVVVLADGLDEASEDVVEVGPLSADELREAISRPAAAVGLSVERALLATAVNDTEGRPGALPLLSHAMLETWRQRRGEVLTLAGYQAAGGVRGAACALAEAAVDRLSAPSRELAADLLLRLVTLDGDVAVPSRRVPRDELLDIDRDAAAVLAELAAARLVTVAGDTVELTHEALVEDWTRLRDWVSADRAGLRVHHELTEAARAWAVDHDPSALYRGTRLITTAEWLHRPGRRVRLTENERAFLDASSAAESRQLATQRRRTAQLRRLSIALALFAVVATVATVVAAVSAHRVSEASKEVRSRQLAAEARLLAPTDVAAAQRKAVDAYLAAPTDEARSVVLSLAGRQTFHGRLAGHAGTVNALAITRDGATMVSGGADGTAVVWDLHARQAKHVLRSAGQVRDVAIGPDGATVALAGRNGALSLWRLSDGRRVAELPGHTGSVESVAFSGESLVSMDSAGAVIVWDVGSRAPRVEIATRGGMDSAFAISPRGDTLAVAAGDGSVTGYDLASGEVTEELSAGPVPLYAVAFHPSDGSLVAAGRPETLFVWDRDRHRQDVPTETDGQVHDLAFAAGGTLYCGCGRQTVAWNPATLRHETVLGARTGAVYSVAASADGSVTASAGADGAVLLWTRARLPLLWHTDGVRGIAISGDGATLASGSGDGTVARWHTADRTLETVHTGHTREVNAVGISRDGRLIASASNDHTVRLWRADAPTPIVLTHSDQVRAVAFSPDGRWLATGGTDGRVLRWDLENPDTPTKIQQHDRAVHTLAFRTDGRMLASAGRDGKVLLTDLRRSATSTLSGHRGRVDTLAFSPDGRHLAAGGAAGDILVWDLGEKSEPWRLRGHSQPVSTLAFSPDGRFLASGGDETSVIIWDFPGRSRWTTLSGHTDKVVSTVWSPNGATLYTGGADGVVIPWVVDTDAALDRVRDHLATGFPTG